MTSNFVSGKVVRGGGAWDCLAFGSIHEGVAPLQGVLRAALNRQQDLVQKSLQEENDALKEEIAQLREENEKVGTGPHKEGGKSALLGKHSQGVEAV